MRRGPLVVLFLCGGDKSSQKRDIALAKTNCSAVEGVTTMEVKFSRHYNYLKTEDDITAYLDAVMEDGDPEPTVL